MGSWRRWIVALGATIASDVFTDLSAAAEEIMEWALTEDESDEDDPDDGDEEDVPLYEGENVVPLFGDIAI